MAPKPSAGASDPPRLPPTGTTTAAPDPDPGPDGRAVGAIVPLPPGYVLGGLTVHPANPATNRRETFTRDLMAASGRSVTGRGRSPGEALAVALGEAWDFYFVCHPKGIDGAAAEACRAPHPQPVGGMAVAGGIIHDNYRVRYPVRLSTSVQETLLLDSKPPASRMPESESTMRRAALVLDGFETEIRSTGAPPRELDFLSGAMTFNDCRSAAGLSSVTADPAAERHRKLTGELRDIVADHTRAVMAAVDRARAAVPPDAGLLRPLTMAVEDKPAEPLRREWAAGCTKAAGVAVAVWPHGWYDGRACCRFTSGTGPINMPGLTRGMTSQYTQSGP
jgi:hypothetical protein